MPDNFLVRLPPAIQRARILIALAGWVIYLGALLLLYFNLGLNANALEVLPVILSAWLLGWRAGLAIGLVAYPLNVMIFWLLGYPRLDAMLGLPMLPPMVGITAIGITVGWLSELRDALQGQLAERKRAEEALRESEEKYHRLVDSAPLGIFQFAPKGEAISVNRALARMFGYDSSEDMLKSVGDVATDLYADPNRRAEIIRMMEENPDLRTFENVYRRKDGSTFIGRLNIKAIRDSSGRLIRTEGIIEDITERKQAEIELQYMKYGFEEANLELQAALAREQELARTDGLTGLKNRTHFFDLATHEFDVALRYRQPLTAIMFDIDRFKQVNDTYGHQMGDHILKAIAKLANEQMRDADILARYGGEEFVALFPHSDAQQTAVVAERIRQAIGAYSQKTGSGSVSVTVSLGIAEILMQGDSLDYLIQRADQAMYMAKAAGRDKLVIFTPPTNHSGDIE